MNQFNQFNQLKIGNLYSGRIEFIATSGSGSTGYNIQNALYLGQDTNRSNIHPDYVYQFFVNEKIIKMNFYPGIHACKINLFEIKGTND